jgi:hypothetical protein
MMKFTVASCSLLIALAASPALAGADGSVMSLPLHGAARTANTSLQIAESHLGTLQTLPAAETPLPAATWLLLVAGLGLVGSRAHRRHTTA